MRRRKKKDSTAAGGPDAQGDGDGGADGGDDGAPVDPRFAALPMRKESEFDRNQAKCALCGKQHHASLSPMALCDYCPRAYHVACLGQDYQDFREADWACPVCYERHGMQPPRRLAAQPSVSALAGAGGSSGAGGGEGGTGLQAGGGSTAGVPRPNKAAIAESAKEEKAKR